MELFDVNRLVRDGCCLSEMHLCLAKAFGSYGFSYADIESYKEDGMTMQEFARRGVLIGTYQGFRCFFTYRLKDNETLVAVDQFILILYRATLGRKKVCFGTLPALVAYMQMEGVLD